ncbi:MAG: tRNA pseudouridine(13) synthase TruD, partial [Myxococcota bacterium]|nr:tRNA pseudouridine(13) synthase TruD [Myxococcota bacterium]
LQKRGWLAEPASGEWYGTDAGGRFEGARDDLATLQKRLDDREIIPLGPMPGRDIQPEGRCAELLSEALSELGLDGVDWAGFGKRLRGSWRSLWVPLCDLSAELDEGAVLLQFSLPAGSYATVLVQRLLEDDWIFPRSC